MKSILVNVMFPAWVWAHEEWAGRRFLTSSYAVSLSVRDGVKMRSIIESPLYRSMFTPRWTLRDDQNQKLKFENTMGGFRFSTSTGGAVTGEGGDFLLADDPLNALEAHSDKAREEANYWWDVAFSTRANNPNAHCKIIIMQRLHENDLTGHVLSKTQRPIKRAHLVFQALYEPNSKVLSQSPLPVFDPRTKQGELLWPERFDQQAVNQIAADLDTKGIGQSHAQLQQDPKPKEGGLFKTDWWQRYETSPASILETVQFWDCAQKPGITNDWSVCTTWARTAIGYFLLDIWREKVEAPVLEAMTLALAQKWRPDAIVIEDKSAGSSLIQYLLRSTALPVIPYNPGQRDKEIRATAATPTVMAKKCHLPKKPIPGKDESGREINLIETFISEHERFPKGNHDDMVDTTSMMVEWFAKRNSQTPRIRSL